MYLSRWGRLLGRPPVQQARPAVGAGPRELAAELELSGRDSASAEPAAHLPDRIEGQAGPVARPLEDAVVHLHRWLELPPSGGARRRIGAGVRDLCHGEAADLLAVAAGAVDEESNRLVWRALDVPLVVVVGEETERRRRGDPGECDGYCRGEQETLHRPSLISTPTGRSLRRPG